MLSFGFLITTYLLASSSNRKSSNNGKRFNQQASDEPRQNTGRRRYGRDGKKASSGSSGGGRKNSKNNTNKRQNQKSADSKQEVSPLPRLTTRDGPRPSYFTCRHSYEETLIEEIQRRSLIEQLPSTKIYSPYPGLVCVEDGLHCLPSSSFDPVYALGSIPNAAVVSGESIKIIAKEVYNALLGEGEEENNEKLRAAPRGSLAVHGLVPGMCKGQRNPASMNRSQKVAEELSLMLRKQFPAARKKTTINEDNMGTTEETEKDVPEERWILQVMLQTPSVAIASLTQCKHIGPGKNCYWPNWYHPIGLAKVDIEETMPSSAYRKLMEALESMRIRPSAKSKAVDLGACPGGWTTVLRMLDCQVTAVDRSKLDKSLMMDDMVKFVKGDAFTYVPVIIDDEGGDDDDEANTSSTSRSMAPSNSWMVSDVIAYPERATELLNRWCGGHWVQHLVVTMKFQGDTPSLVEIDNAVKVAEGHGYQCRTKHFFNNKNEVTLMASELNRKNMEGVALLDEGVLGSPMYQVTLPKPN